MPTSHVQDWDAFKLLDIINEATLSFSCVGYAKTQHRRCWNRVAQHNIASAKQLLQEIPRVCTDGAVLRRRLGELAGLALCRAYHQNQRDRIADRWYQTIRAEVVRRGGTVNEPTALGGSSDASRASRTSTADLQEEIRNLRRQMEELLERERTRASQQSQPRPRSPPSDTSAEEIRRQEDRLLEEEAARHREERREEARRQVERERAEREAEARRRSEQDRLRREEAEAAQRRREQEARERAERERQEWTASWHRYERDWDRMARIDTTTLDEDILESLPWPVKRGKWQDVNDANVEVFLRHDPDDAPQDRTRFSRLLRRQAMRWHEDRVRHCFPRAAGDERVMRLTTLVMQVVNRLDKGSRS